LLLELQVDRFKLWAPARKAPCSELGGTMNQFSQVPADGVAGVGQATSAERVLARSDDPYSGPFVASEPAIERAPLSLVKIEDLQGGGLRLGAFVTNADIAYDPRVMRRYPLLVSAILAGAIPQSRSAVTNGGNLCQLTRCYYFHETEEGEPGDGVKCVHEILGESDSSSATPFSDMGVALTALDAKVRITGPGGERVIPFPEYCRLDDGRLRLDSCLRPGELLTAVELPFEDFSHHFAYLKLCELSSRALARVSVAVALRLEGDRINEARLAISGFAHSPWRSPIAESGLAGERVSHDTFAAAAHDILSGAVGAGDDDPKIEFARGAIVQAFEQAVTAI
jgi:xanthine dehydrogenase YagS FAD-binding subunit